MTTTWNPSDKSANVTLSGSNLIATITSGTNQGVRSTISHSTGKWYAEFKNCFFSTTPSSSSRGGVGIADSTYSLTAGPGSDNIHSAWVIQPPTVIVGNASKIAGAIATAITTSVTIGVAVDVDNHLVWFTENGTTWNNGGTANPATGVGGFSLVGTATMGPAIFLAAWLRWSLDGAPQDTATLNGGGSAFTFSVPSGFSNWDGVTSETGTIAMTLLGITQAMAAISGASANLSMTLPGIQMAGNVVVEEIVISMTLPKATFSAAAMSGEYGTIAMTLGKPTMQAYGEQLPPAGAGSFYSWWFMGA